MKVYCLLFCLILSCTCAAQTTWQGLQFGMDSGQAREALLVKHFSMQQGSNPNTYLVAPDFELETSSSYLSSQLKDEIATAPIYFQPQLLFDNQGKLKTITLNLDQAKVFQATPAFNSNLPALTMVAGTSLFEQLTSKYGGPTNMRGPCGNIPVANLNGSIVDCNAKWNGNGQSIELFWSFNYPLRSLTLFLKYSNAASVL